MILRPAAPLPPTSKTMKMKTVLCISFDSGANRTHPGHFQNYDNDNRPAGPLPPTSKTMKTKTVLCITYGSGAKRTPPKP